MATLGDLHRGLFPTATPVVPLDTAQAERSVTWVRVLKARVPAFDALEPGDLAVVPASALAVVAPGRSEVVALGEALARARVAGVLLLESDAEGEEGSIRDVLAEAGVPTLVLARPDAAPVERAIIGYLVNSRAELDRQAALLESSLERLALGASDLDALVGAVGGFLGRAVALEGRRGDALAVQAPAGATGAAAAITAYLARPRSTALRVTLPRATERGVSPGALVLLGERPPSELERIVAERISGLLALEIARAESVRRARDEARRSEALPAAGPPWVVLLGRQVVPGADHGIPEREETRRELRRLAPGRRMGLRGDASSLELRAVLVADSADPGGLALAGRISEFIGRLVAVSRVFGDPTDRPAAEAEARATLEAAETLSGPLRVARADRLPAYRLMGNLHNLPDGPRQARALLEPLLAGPAGPARDRLATLRVVLESPGLAEAAASLGVHRNTIAYRMHRIEALTGWQLDDPELRFPLALALRLVQDEQVMIDERG